MIKSPKSLSNGSEYLLICEKKLPVQNFYYSDFSFVIKYFSVIFAFIATILCSNLSYSQTVLISPTGDGGFETGNTFALNGWTATIGTATENRWVVGSGATGYIGTRAAYISNNSAGSPPPHAYTFSATSITDKVTHLYRNVTVPAGQNNISLSFRWISAGEGANDRMRIYIVPTNTTPMYGFVLLPSGIVPTGVRQIGNANYSGQASWTTSTVSIPEGYAGTSFRLVFEWTNNHNAVGTNPPAAVDNISLTSSAFTPPANDTCANATLLSVNATTGCTITTNGTTIGASQSTPGCSGTADDDVWYRFVATQASHTITVTPSTLVDAVFQVYSGTCSGLTSLGCINATTGTNAETTTLTNLVNGTTYYVRVYSVAAGENQGTFNVCVNSPAITYCAPTTSTVATLFINNFRFLGTLNDVSNTNSGSVSGGYQNHTALAKSVQAQGEGMNVYVENNSTGRVRSWVDWNKNGVFDDAGEMVYDSKIGITSTTFGFVVPTTVTPGDYRIRIRNYKQTPATGADNFGYDFNPCEAFGAVVIGLGGNRFGEAEDYTFSVVASCAAHITSVTSGETCGNGPVTLAVTGSAGVTEYRWYSAITGGSLLATTPTGSWTTPSISTTTIYYVTAFNGCESLVRTPITAVRSPLPDVVFTPAAPVVCGEDSIISLSVAGDIDEINLINENFESGLGVFTAQNYTANAAVDALTTWQSRASTYVPANQVWFPAISSGFGTNHFVMATSDVGSYTIDNGLISPVVNSTGYLDLTLTFKMYFSRYLADGTNPNGDFVTIDISTDGGTNWTEHIKYIADVGIGTRFQDMSVNLSTYINRANLRMRIRYYGIFRDGVAVDNIRLYGNKPLNTAFTFTSATPVAVFTDALATTPYNSATMTASTVYIKPTLAQLENASFNITANAILSSGCTATKSVLVTNNTRIWSGASTNWNTAASWKPIGVPTASNCIIVSSNNIISGTNLEAYGRNLNVKPTGSLTVNASNTLIITEGIKVDANGIFVLENTSSLVQINDNQNIGNVKVKVVTKPMRRRDYTYWSSPVSSKLLYNLSPLTAPDKFYSWNSNTQSWLLHQGGNVTMANGKGYIVRAPENYSSSAPSVYPTEFNGVPHNGPVTVNVLGNSSPVEANFQWNLIGNPYPSAVNANLFLANAGNASAISGTIYLWTHNTSPTPFVIGTGFYNYSTYDYAAYNLTGGVGVAAIDDPNDPAPSNNFNGTVPTGYIASGQAFFVRGIANASVVFTNAMRAKGRNNEFFRTAQSENSEEENPIAEFERNRIWLNLSNRNGAFSQTLFGYVQGATNGIDNGFDGEAFNHNTISLYSVQSDFRMTIQGRALPFDDNDVVNLGYKSDNASTLQVGIDHTDDFFTDKNIYIKDNLLGIIHDLKNSPYLFETGVGTYNDRFEIVYRQGTLSISNPNFDGKSVLIYKKQQAILVNTGSEIIKELAVVDIQGRLLYDKKNITTSQFEINGLPPVDQVLIIKVITQNGIQVYRKIVY